MSNNKNLVAIGLITSLFFLWGLALNLNPILIPHLKKACELTDLQSSLVDSASYLAYFILPIPAALFMKKYGYKGGILLGLVLFACGAFLFYPAASVRSFVFFLSALFVIFSGAAFLETAANPYITVLGDPKSAAVRINFSQSFNGLAATLAPLIGGVFILSGKTLTATQKAGMTAGQLNTYLNKEASSVQMPYFIIGLVVLLVAILIFRTKLPEIAENDQELLGEEKQSDSGRVWKQLLAGFFGEFFYVGAQAGVLGFFIRFSERVAGMGEKTAAGFLTAAALGFMLGRFSGTYLMQFINPVKLLATYCIINVFLLILAVTLHAQFSVYALIGVAFFMSIMFPTIFSLSIRGLGSRTKIGSSFIIMGIVGGALIPPVMGFVSDKTNIQYAYLVPIVCFLYILAFAYMNLKVKKVEIVAAH
jgi:FHS family L-fucose permease-like MFS transporter